MKATRKLEMLFCMAMLIATFGSSAKADEFAKLTIFTFSAPVELPGDVVLSSGTYIFKLLDISGNRDVVQILDQEQTQVYATILTVPTNVLTRLTTPLLSFMKPQTVLKMLSKRGSTQARLLDKNLFIRERERLNWPILENKL